MDVFGDSSLFDEFEKERSSTGSFILYEKKEGGDEDRSKIIFQIGGSDESDSSSEDDNNADDHSEKEDDSDEENTDLNRDIPNGILTDTNVVKPAEKQTDYKLLHERNKYQRYARVIDSTRYVPDEDSPGCQIIFQNNSFSRRYRTAIEQYITHLIAKDLYENQRRPRLPELNLKSSSLTCVDLNNRLSASQRNNDMWSAHSILGCSQFHRNFLVDTLGWPLVANNPALTDSWEVPRYEQIFLDALPVSEEDDGPGKPPGRPKPSCFNCGGEHMMSECPQPKNFNKIRENRDKFREQSSSLQKQGSQRYHKDPEAQPELNKFKPGQISEDLREALGISHKQLPPYIYKMRVIGYPPGWLEEAKVQTSGLALFDKHGKEVDVSGASMEDGEVDEVVPNQGEINPDRIIEYPGFTIPCPENVIDEYEEFNMPAIQEHQLKSTLSSQIASKKRKAEEVEEQIQQVVKKSRKDTSQDMDLEDKDELNTSVQNGSFVPPLPVDTPPGRPPLPEGTPPITPNTQERKKLRFPLPGQPPLPFDTPPSRPPIPENTPPPTPDSEKEIRNPINRQISGISEKSGRSESPSLEDLEQQYKLLQQRLAEDEDPEGMELLVVDSCEADDDENTQDSSCTDILPTGISRVGSATSINTFGELGTGSPSSSLPGTPIIVSGNMTPNSSFNNLNLLKTGSGSISKDYGTPIAHRVGVADCLPDAQKFGEGIEDHIPYENLPEATGTFDKMRGLIDKIRGKLRKKKT